MKAHALRLAGKFDLSKEEAQALVAAGFDTPAAVKAAKNKDIKDAIGPSGLRKVRAIFPKG